jgi:hypothetical protein
MNKCNYNILPNYSGDDCNLKCKNISFYRTLKYKDLYKQEIFISNPFSIKFSDGYSKVEDQSDNINELIKTFAQESFEINKNTKKDYANYGNN